MCDAPWFVEAAVVDVGVEGGPVLAVLGDLEDPVPERRAAVAPARSTTTQCHCTNTAPTLQIAFLMSNSSLGVFMDPNALEREKALQVLWQNNNQLEMEKNLTLHLT